MKVCPNCQSKYPDDANFCPQEGCATPEGPRRLAPLAEAAPSRFQLQARLGGSRSGEVWQARDGQTGQDVAYKLVAPGALPTPAALERAQRELKQLQRAQNPRIARIVDFGKGADGRLFVASELVAGQTLGDAVAQSGPFPLDRAKKIVAQIGEALLEGQKVGVVHHDLAAKNILLGPSDEVKVINFVSPWPVTETVFGVPEYLSPEQAEGKLVDQRSNTYSLGALLMLMLTGQAPVSGGDEAAVLQQVIRGDVAPPSRRRAGLTPEIDRVVMKAMEKSSSRRPLTMRQFLTDVAGLAVGAPSAGTGVQSQAAFAKTMMFAGGTAPDVSHLVNQAAAARAEANGSGPAAAAQPAFTPTPAPPASPFAMSATPAPTAAQAAPTKRGHGAAVAATMVAMPAASPAPIPGAAPRAAALDASMQPTPPPVSAARPPGGPEAAAGVATDATGAPVGKSPANFRETLWFKKGDVEQMVAEAKAKAQAARGGKASIDDLPLEETKPLEDRYVDDGSLTAEDRKKFSLRSGGPAAAPVPPVGGSIPGERMSESEMLGEIGGGKRIAIVVIAVAVVVALIAVLYVAFRGKSVSQSAKAITPVATPTAATPPAPSPAPAAAQVPPAPPPAPAAADHEGAPPAPAVKAEAPSRPAHAAQTRKHAKKRAAASGKKQRR